MVKKNSMFLFILLYSYLAKEVVSSALAAFVQAVNDLTKLGYSLRIDFGFCQLQIVDRNLNVKYNQSFGSTLNRTTFENKVCKHCIENKELIYLL